MIAVNQRLASAKKRDKAFHETVHQLDELMQAWDNRITLSNLRIAERFMDGEIHFILKLRLIKTAEFWLARFDVKSAAQVKRPHPFGHKDVVFADGEKGAVLVNVVKIMESPERVVPTLVRLEPIYRLHSLMAHSLYLSTRSRFVSFEAFEDRECGVAIRDLPRSDHELPCQVVEGAAQIANYIPDGRDI